MKITSLKKHLSAKKVRIILWSSMICLCIANMMIFNVPSFLPSFVEEHEIWKEGDVSEADIALITGIFAVG